MKKCIILVMAAMTAMSCAKYNAQEVILENTLDSVNYAVGLVFGYQVKMDGFTQDSTSAPITAFMKAFDKTIKGDAKEFNEAMAYGKSLGFSIKLSEEEGLSDFPACVLNAKILLQGLVNGIEGDTVMLQAEEASGILSEAYQASDFDPVATDKIVAAKKVPKGIKVFELSSKNDTLNYALGVAQGARVRMIMSQDTTGEDIENFIKGINDALKCNSDFPELTLTGEQVGAYLKSWEDGGLFGDSGLDVDIELIRQGLINSMRNFGDWDIQEAYEYVNKVRNGARYEEIKIEGEEFLEANKTNENVKVTESGLQYEVIKMGKGKKPAETDVVKVHYTGTFIDGTVFDSSVERGEPATFALNGVISGWTEGLQLMPVGSKFKFYLPYNLGYGENGHGTIPPYSALIFEVELLSIEK